MFVVMDGCVVVWVVKNCEECGWMVGWWYVLWKEKCGGSVLLNGSLELGMLDVFYSEWLVFGSWLDGLLCKF